MNYFRRMHWKLSVLHSTSKMSWDWPHWNAKSVQSRRPLFVLHKLEIRSSSMSERNTWMRNWSDQPLQQTDDQPCGDSQDYYPALASGLFPFSPGPATGWTRGLSCPDIHRLEIWIAIQDYLCTILLTIITITCFGFLFYPLCAFVRVFSCV